MESISAYLSGFLAILLFTAFIKIVTTLSIMRYGLGLGGAGFGLVILGLSLALALFVSAPDIEKVGGLDALLKGKLAEGASFEADFRPFVEKHTNQDTLKRFISIQARFKKEAEPKPAQEPALVPAPSPAPDQPVSFPVLLSAFMVSELKGAFQLGFLFIIPFIVIDLIVANALMALGVTQLPHLVLALPLKLLLFFLVDGWTLVTEKLIGSYF